MKNLLQFASNFPLTIRRLADRQDVSDACWETGYGSAKLFGIVCNFDSLSSGLRILRNVGRSRKRFPAERVFCSLSAGSDILLERPESRRSRCSSHCGNWQNKSAHMPNQHSENKETIGPSNGREDRSPPKHLTARPGTRWAEANARRAKALPPPPWTERRKTSCLPGSNCHSEGRGFLSSLFSPFLGTTHGQESSEISTPVLNSTLGGRGVLFRSCLLFVLQSVASLLSLGVYL